MKKPLHQQFPQLTLSYTPLITGSSELMQTTSELWVKDDSRLAVKYGGNKVRKLEYLFADAQRQGAKNIFSFGFTGSNFATASAIFAQQLGLSATSMLLPQLNEPYVSKNLRASAASGAELVQRPNTFLLALTVIGRHLKTRLTTGRAPYWFPAGGSKPVGVVGFVNAAFELAAQWPQRKPPEKVYIAVGSMGSAVGLAIGFALMGWPTQVEAIRVIESRYANPKAAKKLTRQVLKLLDQQRLPIPALDKVMQAIQFRDDFFGGAYGKVTDPALAAVHAAAEENLQLDTTYSGKAFAAALSDVQQQKAEAGRCVFWNTHNGVCIDALANSVDNAKLPAALQPYLQP